MTRQLKTYAFVFLLAIVTLAGCSNKPPGCADEQTSRTARDLIIQQASGFLKNDPMDDPDGLISKFIQTVKVELINVLDEGYKSDAKKQFCKATLRVSAVEGKGSEGVVSYSTQRTVDDKDSFILELENAQWFGLRLSNDIQNYYKSRRWTGTWGGTYSCEGLNGATDGPQGPYSMPVSMVVDYRKSDFELFAPIAILERTTRGGGVEKLQGKVSSKFVLEGDGQNSPDDTWHSSFDVQINGNSATGDGAISRGGVALRRCLLNLKRGAEPPAAASPPVAESTSLIGTYAAKGSEGNITAEIAAAGSDGKYKVKLSTNAPSGCGGAVTGTATSLANSLAFVSEGNGERCEIALKNAGPGQLDVQEGKGCNYYHGASCSFSDRLKKTR